MNDSGKWPLIALLRALMNLSFPRKKRLKTLNSLLNQRVIISRLLLLLVVLLLLLLQLGLVEWNIKKQVLKMILSFKVEKIPCGPKWLLGMITKVKLSNLYRLLHSVMGSGCKTFILKCINIWFALNSCRVLAVFAGNSWPLHLGLIFYVYTCYPWCFICLLSS